MRKSLKSKVGIFPMPVLMIGTYNDDNTVNVMNAAWGAMLDINKVALNLTETHKTVKNIKKRGAFTVSLADLNHITEADYFGIVSGNNVLDKFEKTNLTATKSNFVNAPIIEEFPVTMECKFIEFQDGENGIGVIGEIINTSVDEKYIDKDGNVDVASLNIIAYDPFNHGYYVVNEKVGNAFKDGRVLK